MPIVANAIAGFLVGAGVNAAVAGVAANLLVSTALSLVQQALLGQQERPAPSGIQTRTRTAGDTTPQSFILGCYATAGNMTAPPMSHGRVGGTPNAFMTALYDVSDMPVTALQAVWLEDEKVSLGAPLPAGSIFPGFRPVTEGKYAGSAWFQFFDGRQTAASPHLLSIDHPSRPWVADMIGRGVAGVICIFEYDEEAYRGEPRPIFEVDGIPLYDPRLDTSVGGSGAQRWATPSTWALTRNPAVMIYNILRGITLPDGSRWGGEAAAEDLPLDSWFAAMNECDLAVDGEPQYRAGYEVRVGPEDMGGHEPARVVEELLRACSGQIMEYGGTWKMRAGPPGMPVAVFSDEDIIVSEEQTFEPFPGLHDTYNGVHAQYPEPAEKWVSKEAPPRYNAAYEAQDKGRRLIASLSLAACPYPKQTQRLMLSYLEDGRRHRRHALTLPQDYAAIEPLDAAAWNSARNGYAGKVFEIGSKVDGARSLLQRVSTRERDPADYGWQPGFELPTTVTPVTRPPLAPQAVPGWSVAATEIRDANGTGRIPAIILGWDPDQPGVRGIRWEVRVQGRTELAAANSTQAVVAGGVVVSEGIIRNSQMEARGRIIVPGRATAWTPWVPVTIPDVRIGRDEIDDTPPGKVTGLTLATTLGFVTATWDAMAGAASYDAEISEVGGAAIVSTTPLTSHRWAAPINVTVSVRVRAVDRVGNRGYWSDPETILTARDTVPPATPTGLALTPGFGVIWAAWRRGSEPDLSHYEVISSPVAWTPTADAVPDAITAASEHVWAGLAHEETRFVRVRAVDTSGNKSPWSGSVSAKTPAAEAITPEDIRGIVDATSFAAGLEPITIHTGAALPTTKLTSVISWNGKLYRWNGTAYVASVDTTDLVGKVTGPQIADAAVGASQLAQSAVTGPHIATGAVLASHMAVADFTNLVPDPGLLDPASWSLGAGWTLGANSGTGARSAGELRWAAGSSGSTYLYAMSAPFLISEGAEVLASAQIFRASASATVEAILRVQWLSATQTTISNPTVATLINNDALVPLTGSAVAPAGAVAGRLWIGIKTAATNGNVIAALPEVRIKARGQLIVDGSITGVHVASDTMETRHFKTGSVVASKIAVVDMTNLVPDGDLQDAAAWTGSGVLSQTHSQSGANSRGRILLAKGNTQVSRPFPVASGQQLLVSFQATWSGSSGTRDARVGLIYYNNAGAELSRVQAAAVTTTGLQYAEGSLAVPAGAFTASMYLEVPATAGYNAYFYGPSVRIKANASLIVDGAIFANHLTVNAIQTSHISAGAVQAAQIAAGAITASRVGIGDFTNLAADATLSDPAAWTIPASVTMVPETYFSWASGATSYASVASKLVPVQPGEEVFAGGWLYSDVATDSLRLGVRWFDSAKAFLTTTLAPVKTTSGGSPASMSAVAPANAAFMSWVAQPGGTALTGAATAKLPVLRRRFGGELIVDGAVRSNHLVTNEAVITGTAQIADLIVTSEKVFDLTAAKIRGGTALLGTVTVSGTALGTTTDRAADPAQQVNAGSTKIDPGKIIISGGTTLADWRYGGDATQIHGGRIAANTIAANKLEIGSRNISLTGIQFEHNSPGPNQVSWSSGSVKYVNDVGVEATRGIPAGNATWSSGVLYIYWVKDALQFSVTTSQTSAFGPDRLVIATYEGGVKLDADYGRTVVDGDMVKTGTLTARALVKTAALITEEAQIQNAVVGTLKIAGNAVTVPASAKATNTIALIANTPAYALTATFTREGARTAIWFSCQVDGTNLSFIQFDLFRDTTLIESYASLSGANGTQSTTSFTHIDNDLGTGSTTYVVKATTRVEGVYDAKGRILTRSLVINHVKR